MCKWKRGFPFYISRDEPYIAVSLREGESKGSKSPLAVVPPLLVVWSSGSGIATPLLPSLWQVHGCRLCDNDWRSHGIAPGLTDTTQFPPVIMDPTLSFRAYGFVYSMWRLILSFPSYRLLWRLRWWGRLWLELPRPIRQHDTLITRKGAYSCVYSYRSGSWRHVLLWSTYACGSGPMIGLTRWGT